MEDVKDIGCTCIKSFFNLWFLGFIVLIYVLLYSFQSVLIYHPRKYEGRYVHYYHRAENIAKATLKDANGGVVKEIEYITEDNMKYTAYWIPPFKRDYFKRCSDKYLDTIRADNSLPHFELWITANGNAGLAKDWLVFASEYAKRQYQRKNSENKKYVPSSFFLLDYPGYGKNGGSPSPSTVLTSYSLAIKALQIKMRAYYSAKNIKNCNKRVYFANDKNRFGINFKLNAVAHSIGSSAALQVRLFCFSFLRTLLWHIKYF
jgi:hypothetical protein